jgi:hypothetical protein
MINLFNGHSESRSLLKKVDDRHDASLNLTIAQVGLGQSRGYLLVRELPDGSSLRRWCILKDERLWFFDAPDSSKAGMSLPLENAVNCIVSELMSSSEAVSGLRHCESWLAHAKRGFPLPCPIPC